MRQGDGAGSHDAGARASAECRFGNQAAGRSARRTHCADCRTCLSGSTAGPGDPALDTTPARGWAGKLRSHATGTALDRMREETKLRLRPIAPSREEGYVAGTGRARGKASNPSIAVDIHAARGQPLRGA